MTPEQQASHVMAQSVAALAEIEGMKAENMQREVLGQSMAYDESSFLAVIKRYGLDHNTIMNNPQ